MMECWVSPLITPVFHHSIIPFFWLTTFRRKTFRKIFDDLINLFRENLRAAVYHVVNGALPFLVGFPRGYNLLQVVARVAELNDEFLSFSRWKLAFIILLRP
jgi:uncharacterized membrane protein